MSRDGGRQFTEREVALILKTAGELQERDGGEPAVGARGLTLAQLEQVAVESGIDPSLVRRAVEVVDAPRAAPRPNRFLGGPTEVVVERVVDGELDAAAFDAMLEAALDTTRRATGELGQVSTVGRLFGWRGRLDGAKSEVGISSRGGRTTVRVRVALDEVALGSFMTLGALFGGGVGIITLAVALNPLGAAAALAAGAVAGSGYLGARGSFSRAAARYGERAAELADALAARVAAAVAEGARPGPAPNVARNKALQ